MIGAPTAHKAYIGDGVYVDHDELGIVLTTENGIETTNRIVLEPEVLAALLSWVLKQEEKKRDQS